MDRGRGSSSLSERAAALPSDNPGEFASSEIAGPANSPNETPTMPAGHEHTDARC